MNNDINIVIIGGDHHNGLGLARIFGVNGYNVDCIVVDECKKSFLRFSKFVKNCVCFSDENEALDYIIKKYKNRNKTFLIPYSDGTAYSLDNRLDEFSDFIVPSINRHKGNISKMMIKSNQYDFASKNGIKMAKTEEANFNNNINSIWRFNIYPCIIKPVISAEGNKKDITVCENRDDLEDVIRKYKKNGYARALIQEYLDVDFEIDVFGCILDEKPYIYLIPTRTIRSWPIKGGTNSFSKIITDKKIIDKCYEIINKVRDAGFRGLYDIELFVINDDIYLNEINYRNSGDVYMAVNQKFYYPLYWINDCLKIANKEPNFPKKPSYSMTECADIRNVLKKKIKLKTWIQDFKKCEDYALKFRGDMLPVFVRYFSYVLKFLSFKKY